MRELELLLLTMFAAVPLYGTQGVSRGSVALFHIALFGVLIARRLRTEALLPQGMLNVLAVAYLIFYPVDGLFISHSLIAASTHLVFFIAVYQALERVSVTNHGKRMVVLFLIFISSIATATHITIVFFIVAFTYMAVRQLMYLTHDQTLIDAGVTAPTPPVMRPALVAVVFSVAIAALLFPFLPRVHNPLVRGFLGSLQGSSTGLSDTIDFRLERQISPDPTVVARVWMPRDAVPFFAPLRLRGRVYDEFDEGEWRSSLKGLRILDAQDGIVPLAQPSGFRRTVTVQQTIDYPPRLYPPSDTFAVSGIPTLYQYGHGFRVGTGSRGKILTYEAQLSRHTLPLVYVKPPELGYPITPAVTEMARTITRGARTPEEMAAKIETYLATTFRYVPDPASIGRAITVDEFLLQEKRGHCEYFAAGMVVLLESLGIDARIIGGFYGGKLNPLTGYFVIQRSDAHAWVEVYDGEKWATYDPTPAQLRPGNTQQGLMRAYASALTDSINYLWDRYVLTFGLADQVAIAAAAIEAAIRSAEAIRAGAAQLAAPDVLMRVVVVALGIAAGLWLVSWLLRKREPTYRRLLRRLRRLGIEVRPSMTATEVIARVAKERPHLEPAVKAIVEEHLLTSFSTHETPAEMRVRAREALRQVRA